MFCHRPLALSSSVSSVTVLLVSPSLSSVIVPLFCHRPSPLSPSPSSVTVPLLCHRPSPLSPSVTVPLLCHRPSTLSPSITVPLLCHRPPPLSRPSPLSPSLSSVTVCHRPPPLSPSLSSVTVLLLSSSPCSVIVPLLFHRPSALSSSSPLSPSPCSVIVSPFQQRMLSGTAACFISLWQSYSLPSSFHFS